jgi:hypothetical protein
MSCLIHSNKPRLCKRASVCESEVVGVCECVDVCVCVSSIHGKKITIFPLQKPRQKPCLCRLGSRSLQENCKTSHDQTLRCHDSSSSGGNQLRHSLHLHPEPYSVSCCVRLNGCRLCNRMSPILFCTADIWQVSAGPLHVVE